MVSRVASGPLGPLSFMLFLDPHVWNLQLTPFYEWEGVLGGRHGAGRNLGGRVGGEETRVA